MAEDYIAPKYPRIPFEEDMRRKLSQEDIAELRSLRAQGWSYEKLGKYFAVSKRTAQYHSDPDWAAKQNAKRWQRLKQTRTKEEKKEQSYTFNQRLLERARTDPLFKEFKAKHTYKWKKKRLSVDPEFKRKTREQALDKYYRDKALGKEPRKKA